MLSLARQLDSQSQLHDNLLGDYSKSKPLIDEVRRRFSFIEEFICHLCFKGYTKLVRSIPIVNPFELDSDKGKTKFKEDFQFELDENLTMEDVDRVAEILQTFARFGVGGEKIYLLAELLLAKYLEKLSLNTLGQLTYCLAQTKRAVRNV